jgi:hypothetical protein
MALCTDKDVQNHLPVDKLKFEEIPDDREQLILDAERVIRGHLAGVLSASTLATWLDPDSTPQLIRAIAGRLVAAQVYRLRYSEDSLDDPEFAQRTYDEAMRLLMGIITGSIILEEVEEPTTQFDNTYFWPNNSTAEPKFTMDDGRF